MALKYPDILEHNNPNLPLVDITSLKGVSIPINSLSETGSSIPSAKRNPGAIVFVTGSQEFYGYKGQDATDSNWLNPSNWELLGSGASVNTGSLMTTASAALNVITFTKGDGNTFAVTVDTGSAPSGTISSSAQVISSLPSGIVSGSSQVTDGSGIFSGSLVAGTNVTINQDGNNFVISSSAGGGSADLTQQLTANLTVGGVTSGDTFASGSSIEQLLRDMLITYQEPTLGALSIRNGGSAISTAARDVGASFTCDDATFTAGVDSPNGDYPQSASLSCTGADIGSFSEDGPNDVVASNTITFGTSRTISRATDSGTVTFTVSTDSRNSGDTQSTSRSFSFQWRNYLAASSTVISSGTTLQSVLDNDLVQSPLDTNKSWNATCNSDNNDGTKYTYIMYPAAYGDLSGIIQDGATPVLGAFTKLGDYTADNPEGSSNSFRVYQSNARGAFGNGVTLAIS